MCSVCRVITGNQPEYKLDELIEEGALGVLTALLARGGAAMVGKVTGNGNNAGENLDTGHRGTVLLCK